MNKKGTSYFIIILVLFALTYGVAFTELKKSNVETDNLTNTLSLAMRNATEIDFNITLEESPELGNAINYYVNGFVKALGEIFIWILKFVEANPEAPYKLLAIGLILAILAPILIVLFKLGVIIFLLTKEYIQSRKEKKEIRKYARRKEN